MDNIIYTEELKSVINKVNHYISTSDVCLSELKSAISSANGYYKTNNTGKLSSTANEVHNNLKNINNNSRNDVTVISNMIQKYTAAEKISSNFLSNIETLAFGGNGILGSLSSQTKSKIEYVKSLSPKELRVLQLKNKVTQGVNNMFIPPSNDVFSTISSFFNNVVITPVSNVAADIWNGVSESINDLTSGSFLNFFGGVAGSIGVFGNSVKEGIMGLGENILDGITGVSAEGVTLDGLQYGTMDFNYREKMLDAVGEAIKIEHTKDYWEEYWNSAEGKTLDAISYLKHDGAFSEMATGATKLAGYIGMSLVPPAWFLSAGGVGGEIMEDVLNNGGTLDQGVAEAAPFIIGDFALNAVGFKGVGTVLKGATKGAGATLKTGMESAGEAIRNGTRTVIGEAKKLVDNLNIPKLDVGGVVSRTKATIDDFTSLMGNKLADERGAIDWGGLFGKGKKATGISDEAIEKSSGLHALPKRESYITLTEDDFEDFSSELIRKLERDPQITTKPTKEIIREDFWQGFSNVAENTYFERGTLNYLDSLVKDENMVVAIHKTGSASDATIKNIMEEGLYVNGALLQGLGRKDTFPGITRTATFVSNKKGLAESLQAYYVSPSDFSGKGSRNSIVVAYPKGLSESDVVQYVDDIWSIKPEYIVGYVPAVEKGGITSVEGIIRNPKWYGVKNVQSEIINEKGLIDARKLPLSEDEVRRSAQQKIMNGEMLTLGEKLKAGRDSVTTKIGDYELKSDYAYRAIDSKVLEEYAKTGQIYRNTPEYIPGENNGGIDWYLGGASAKYGNIILECPADPKYFTLTLDHGSGMAQNPLVRHIKSSSKENTIPFEKVTRIFITNPENKSEIVRVISPIELKKIWN